MRALHSYLYAGVTTVFDAGNRSEFIMGLRAKEQSGAIVSPRILATGGTVASPNGHGGPYNIEAWPADRKLLDEHLATKPDLAKIGQDEHGWGTRPQINQLPEDLLEKIIRYYHSKGVRVIIHTSNEHNSLEAIYAGADTMAHPMIQAPMSEEYLKMMARQARADGVDADHRRELQPCRRPSRSSSISRSMPRHHRGRRAAAPQDGGVGQAEGEPLGRVDEGDDARSRRTT